MGKTINEFCRICDNCNSQGPSGFSTCRVVDMKEQERYVFRGWCGKGKIGGIEISYISRAYIEIRYKRYARRGSLEDDKALSNALITGKGLEEFGMPLDEIKSSFGMKRRH